VETVNWADVEPPGIRTVPSVVTAAWLLLRLTVRPGAGAGALTVMVPREAWPTTRLVGLNVSPTIARGLIVRVALTLTVPSVAVIVASVWVLTARVAMLNVTDDEPAAAVTVFATRADDWLLLKATLSPPVGAGPVRVKVPVELTLPPTVVGFNVKLLREAGLIVKVPVAADPVILAVTFAAVDATTAVVTHVKVAELEPAVTVMVEGPPHAADDDVKVTLTPPLGATPVRVTAPVEWFPPTMLLGLNVTELSFGA